MKDHRQQQCLAESVRTQALSNRVYYVEAEAQGRRIGGYLGANIAETEQLDSMGTTLRRQAAEKKVLGREKPFYAKQKEEMLNNEDEDVGGDIECPNCHEMIPSD